MGSAHCSTNNKVLAIVAVHSKADVSFDIHHNNKVLFSVQRPKGFLFLQLNWFFPPVVFLLKTVFSPCETFNSTEKRENTAFCWASGMLETRTSCVHLCLQTVCGVLWCSIEPLRVVLCFVWLNNGFLSTEKTTKTSPASRRYLC